MALDHIGRGPKSQIANAITEGKVVAGDLVVTNGENGEELVLIERDNSPVVIKSRTQNDIKVTGVDLGTDVPEGTTIPAGMDMDTLAKMLLQKRVAAVYEQPELSFAVEAATVAEIGSYVDANITSTFIPGDAGAVTAHTLKINGATITTVTDNELSYDNAITVHNERTAVTTEVTYDAGEVKLDNFGEESPNGQIAAGSLTSNEFVIIGVRKLFFGSMAGELPTLDSAAIRALNGELSPVDGELRVRLTVKAGDKHIVFAAPEGVTVNEIAYLDLGDRNMLANFTSSVVPVESANAHDDANYNVYTYSLTTATEVDMHFEFVVTRN